MKLFLLLITMSIFFTACEFFETSDDCNPVCKEWETCNDEGHCVLQSIACTEARDCPEAMPVCDILNHKCIEDDNVECYANDECSDPEKPICHKGICIKKPDECQVNTDCTNSKKPICDNGICVEEPCIPNCNNRECGNDGCGGVCGECGVNQACNSHHQCEVTCTPKTCVELNAVCGDIDNGCGTDINCGSCNATQSCSNNQCVDNCTPKTCAELNAECGDIDNGCGTDINCGTCSATQSCSNNQCVDNCTPKTCAELNAECGDIDNGCGTDINCGSCNATQSCSNNQCVDNCTPKTCAELNAICGDIDNGCGTDINCGSCSATQSCSNNQCIENANGFNGSFESWTSNVLNDWTVFSQLILEKEETTVYDLSTSVKLTRDTNADDNALTALESIAIPVTEGSVYTLASYVLDNVDTVRIRINYMWIDSNGDKLGNSVYGSYSSDSQNWENLTATTDAAPAGAVSIKIFFRVYNEGTGGNTGSVYLDNVTITEN